MTTQFVETRTTRDGTQSIIANCEGNWFKVSKPVPGYNGGKPQYEMQIASTDTEQLKSWKELMPNLNVKEEGPTTFTLKRPAWLGAPAVVDEEGNIIETAARATIGNGSTCNVKVSHKNHPKTNRPYLCLEAIKITKMVEFVPDTGNFDDNFDF